MSQWKHLPSAYLKKSLDEQQSQSDEDESSNEFENQDFEFPPIEENQQDDFQDENEEGEENFNIDKLKNDINSANGRVKKLEEENARLRLQFENEAFAAKRLLEIQKEREAKEAEENKSNDDSDDDFDEEELSLELGEKNARLILNARKEALEAKSNLAKMQESLNNEKLEQKRFNFSKAVAEQIPNIQPLLENDQFIQFLKNKKSFSGETAFDFVVSVPQNLSINQIPQVKALIDEYQQTHQNNGNKRKPTTPPRQKSDEGFKQEKLKDWTPKDKAYLAQLMRVPNNKEAIAKFKSQFKKE